MVKAYILIEMMAGNSRHLVEVLTERNLVKVVDRVTGPYDVVALVEAEDLNGISELVASEIHTLPGVVRTNTCVSLE